MSSSSSGSGHGGGWDNWVLWALVALYAVVAVWAYNTGLSPWVFIYGTLGSVGIVWFAYHCTHAIHAWLWFLFCMALGCWAAVEMVTPVYAWAAATWNGTVYHAVPLTDQMAWCYLTLGSIGTLFLAYELGHKFHAWSTKFGLGMGGLLIVALFLTKPGNATFAPVPPLTPRAMPTRSAGHPGFGGASGGSASGSTAAPSPVATSTKPVDCDSLPRRVAQAAGCKR